VVIKVTIRTRLGVAARPDTDVDGINRLVIRAAVLGQRPNQGFDVESTFGQRVIETTPPPAVGGLQAQMWQQGDRTGRQQSIAWFE
jgi:hypothetical protein